MQNKTAAQILPNATPPTGKMFLLLMLHKMLSHFLPFLIGLNGDETSGGLENDEAKLTV